MLFNISPNYILNQLVHATVTLCDKLGYVCVYEYVLLQCQWVCVSSVWWDTPWQRLRDLRVLTVVSWPQSWLLIWHKPLESVSLYQQFPKQQACKQLLLNRCPLCPQCLDPSPVRERWYLTRDHTHTHTFTHSLLPSWLPCISNYSTVCHSACVTFLWCQYMVCGFSEMKAAVLLWWRLHQEKAEQHTAKIMACFSIWFEILIPLILVAPAFN